MSTIGSESYAADCAAAFEVKAGGGYRLLDVGCDGSLHAQMKQSDSGDQTEESVPVMVISITVIVVVGCICFIAIHRRGRTPQRDQRRRRGYAPTHGSDTDDGEVELAVSRKGTEGDTKEDYD